MQIKNNKISKHKKLLFHIQAQIIFKIVVIFIFFFYYYILLIYIYIEIIHL